MNVETLVARARADFTDLPRLELTLPPAARLWSVGVEDCRLAIDALIESAFVMWTARRTIVRTGRDLPVSRNALAAFLPAGQRLPSYIDVQPPLNRDKAV